MITSTALLKTILDSVTEHIVVVDAAGDIVYINQAWKDFGNNNHCLIDDSWDGINYLTICDQAAAMGDDYGVNAARGIRSILDHSQKEFFFEYPCHSPTEIRWFMMRVNQLIFEDKFYLVISHQNITERKIAEEKVQQLAILDGLTNIPNRRHFNDFLLAEWNRCKRLKMPLTLAIIDLDHFKLLNDTYGHQTGDECLIQVASILKSMANRPSDICARYGGEEFAMIFGNTDSQSSNLLINRVICGIKELNFPNKNSPTLPIVSASIGVVTMLPNDDLSIEQMIKTADELLYQAKNLGRNQAVYQT